MKLIKSYMTGITIVLLSGIMGVSCTKTFDQKLGQNNDLSNASIVQVYMAMVNANRNYVYVDGGPITGSLMVSGSVFPTTGYGANIAGGMRSFLVRDTLSTSTQAPLPFAENLQAGKNYTVFVYDTINAPNQRTVVTPIVVPTDTAARIRFANFVYNPTVIPNVDIYSKVKQTNVFTNIPVTGVTDFIPYPSTVTDTFLIRPTGTTTNLQNINPTTLALSDVQAILTPTKQRSYTLVFRGSWRGVSTTSSTVRQISVMVNR